MIEGGEQIAFAEFQDYLNSWLNEHAPDDHALLIVSGNDGRTTIFAAGETQENKLKLLDKAREAILNPDNVGVVPKSIRQ